MKGEGSVVQGERRGVAGAACVALLWMGVWDATWGRERTPEHDRVFWESVECTVAAEVEAYLSEFPEGRYEREARACLDDIAWSKVESCASEEGLEAYLTEFPEGKYEQEARACLGKVEEELGGDGRMLVQRGLVAALGEELVVDGLFGPRTRAAIVRWQREKGYEGTGRLTQEQSEALKGLGRSVVQREEREERLARERAERAERERAERERLEAEKKQAVGSRIRDCEECPELVVVPAGSYRMGSPSGEAGRRDREGPVQRVEIGERLAVGVYEVTVGQWRGFARETGYSAGDRCRVYEEEQGEWKWRRRSGRNWERPGFVQDEGHPVVCVSWEDAQAYVEWLRGKTGKGYRLLSESEWEYVARGGTRSARYWGEGERGQCRYENGADESARRQYSHWTGAVSCDDGYVHTSPVGRYEANGYGLHDVLGNVWEWVEGCWNESYDGAPADGSAWMSGFCDAQVLRGGSWRDEPRDLRSANRNGDYTVIRSSYVGFRIVRTL